jgi:hypothetical protein
VVVAGGWVPHLYELLYDASTSGRSPRTRDLDLAVPRSIPVRDNSIDRLLTSAGFRCEFTSATTPPVTKYISTDRDQEVEIEFITDAPGESEAVISVQPGLTAQELHYVSLLLSDPWTVDLGQMTGGAVCYSVLVPSPAAFVIQKALVFRRRRDRLKAEKDLYYIFFVLESFPNWSPLIAADLSAIASARPAWFKRCQADLKMLFGGSNSAGVDAILNQRPQTAFSGMSDEQFRHYVHSVILGLVELMDSALSDRA